MGILTRQLGTKYVISSDRALDGIATKRAPRLRAEFYQVWTGSKWSVDMADAQLFDSLDEADEYVKSHYPSISASK
jgi:hypothetical protein